MRKNYECVIRPRMFSSIVALVLIQLLNKSCNYLFESVQQRIEIVSHNNPLVSWRLKLNKRLCVASGIQKRL